MPVYKDKKRKTYYFEGSYVDLLGNNKRYKRRGFKTSKEAKEAERLFLLEIKDKNRLSLTLDDIANEYFSYAESRIKMSSIITFKNRYELHIKPYFSSKKIDKITPNDIIKWQKELINKNYSTKYIQSMHELFNRFYTFAGTIYGLNYNPLKIVGRAKNQKKNTPKMNVWEIDEFNKFMSVIEDPMDQCLFRLLYMNGMRKGECVVLQWKDYDGYTIQINKTYSKISKEITYPKTDNSIRKIDLDTKTCEMLNNYLKICKDYDGYSDDKYIFGFHKPYSFTTLKRRKDLYIEKAGVKYIRIHDFRHSHASILISKGIPITAVAERIGDTVETVMNVYAHLMKESNEKIKNLLNEI